MFAKLIIVLIFELTLSNLQGEPQPVAIGSCSFDVGLCKVSCEGVPEQDLLDAIKNSADETCDDYNVELIGINFENQSFYGKLLPLPVIDELELRDCKFNNIEKEAVALVSAVLKIINSKMRSLEKTTFELAQNLTQFKFICETYEDFWMEPGAFTGMQHLKILEIHKCLSSEQHVWNLTARALENLEVLDLTDNELKQLGSLVNFPNLQVIYLQHNKLMEIKRESFYGTKLHTIDLSNNLLQVIEEGIFAHFRGNLLSSGNPWDCNNCTLFWFKSYLLRYSRNSNEGILINKAYQPKCFNQTNLVDFYFNCSENKVVACIDASKLKPFTTSVGDQYSDIEVIFNESPVYFTFFHVNDNSMTTTIMSAVGFNGKHFIYWHDNNNMTNKHCFTNMPSYPIAMKFLSGSTYTICLTDEEDTKVDPSSCFGLKVWEDSGNGISRSWKTTMIVVASALLVTLRYCLKRRSKKIKIVVKTMDPNLNVQEESKTGYLSSVFNWFKKRRQN